MTGVSKPREASELLAGQYTAEDIAVSCTFAPDPSIGSTECLEASASSRIGGVQLQSMVSNVKDLLPDLGEGFIELCLEEYNYKIEDVINAVLEDKLIESLHDLDRTMPKTSSTVDETENESSILDKRANVYDHDEFDVFHRDNIDQSKIHIGKKEKTADAKSVLDDKEAVQLLRPLYDKYGSEDVESMYDPKMALYEDTYEDEYDDTYDINMVGATDADSVDELSARRQFVVPRVLGGVSESSPLRKGEDVTDSDEDSDDERKRDQFVQDPAVLRAKQEERRASKEARHKKPHPNAQPKTHDVKGAAKGQGQTSDVTKNRAWKEKHKSSRVHHNRKSLSDKKRKV